MTTRQKQLLEKMIRAEVSKYTRASKKSIGDELYVAKRQISNLYDSLSRGQDLHPKDIISVINLLKSVLKQAQQFDSGTMPINPDYR